MLITISRAVVACVVLFISVISAEAVCYPGYGPGDDPGIPYDVQIQTIRADMVVQGVVARVDSASLGPKCTTGFPFRRRWFVFIELESIEYLKGSCQSDSIVFHSSHPRFMGYDRDSSTGVSRTRHFVVPGDSVLVWLDIDENEELSMRRLMFKGEDFSGHHDWSPDSGYAFSVQDNVEWVRALAESRTPDRLLVDSDAVICGRVERQCYAPVSGRDYIESSIAVDYDFHGTVADTVVRVVVPSYRDFSDMDFVRLEPGDDVLLFLDERSSGSYEIRGGRDGAYVFGTGCWHLTPAETRDVQQPQGVPCEGRGRATSCQRTSTLTNADQLKEKLTAIYGRPESAFSLGSDDAPCWAGSPELPLRLAEAYIDEDGVTTVVRVQDSRGCDYTLCRCGAPGVPERRRCVFIGARHPSDPQALVVDPHSDIGRKLLWALGRGQDEVRVPNAIFRCILEGGPPPDSPGDREMWCVGNIYMGLMTCVCPFGAASNWRLQPPVLSVTPAADAPGAPD